MFRAHVLTACFGVGLTLLTAATASAAAITVDSFGDGGWFSDDTRSSAGTNLVGLTSTAYGKPGQPATAADDIDIAKQIKFQDFAGRSVVSLDGTATGSGKSNIAVVNTVTGFAAASHLTSDDFFATYDFYKQHNGAGSTLAFKIGIQSTEWTASQAGFTAQRSGEQVWDLVLVHVPTVANNTWTTVNLDDNTGTWTLFKQAGNNYFTIPGPLANPFAQTLDEWALDPTFGNLLFGAGAMVSSIQFGLGSGQAIALGHVDFLQTSLINGRDGIDFGAAAVPEPASMLLLASGLASVVARKRSKSRR